VRTKIADGETTAALVESSAHVDLLVLGSRGYGPLKRVLLGSVSRAAVNDARCPVLIVPRGVSTLDSQRAGAQARSSAGASAA
jgi:nucleotide-binding universal stress UspA family protein